MNLAILALDYTMNSRALSTGRICWRALLQFALEPPNAHADDSCYNQNNSAQRNEREEPQYYRYTYGESASDNNENVSYRIACR